jgi:hypothetical protein
MHRLIQSTLLLAGLCAAALITSGCDSGMPEPGADTTADTAEARPADAMAERPPDEIGAERLESLPKGVKAEIPEDFPDDVAIYPGSVTAQGKGGKIDGAPTAALQLMSLDPPDKVFAFYKDELERQGWTIEEREGFAEKNAITAHKGDCRASMLAAPTSDGGSDIFLISDCST